MLSFTDNYFLISGLIVLAILIGLISGAYPSLILSGFHPVSVIKGKIKTSASSLFIRRGLVLLQFTISIILIVGTVVVSRQLSFIQNKKLGFDKEQMLILRMAESNVQKAKDSFRSELLRNPSVRAVSASSNLQGGSDWGMPFQYEGAEAYLLAWPLAYSVSHSWLQRFAYRISLSFAPFLFSGMLAMIIAFITVSFLSIKAANANPVDSLRYE